MNILYVGGFILPDKNAAAQRVVSIAKALRDLGHNVIFLNAPKENVNEGWKEYFGFECYEYKREGLIDYLTSCNRITSLIEKKKIKAVIAYNHPAVALKRLVQYCRKNRINCYADATEWYVAQGNPIFRIVKNFDSNLRMKKVHFQMDGIIAISEFLFSYYRDGVKTIKVPPLVDIQENKWRTSVDKNTSVTKLVYAGSPDSQKERLDILVNSVDEISSVHNVILNVVGITKEQYESIYGTNYCGTSVFFQGRVSHDKALQFVKEADWSVVIRDNNRVVKAGFPTKVAESISAGTPVIANRFSNIEDYLDETNSILIDGITELAHAIDKAVSYKTTVDVAMFDYRNYVQELANMFEIEGITIGSSHE